VRGITPEARTILVRYAWPGNVRELRNVIENMVLLARGDVLSVDDIPAEVRPDHAGSTNNKAGGYQLAGRSLAEVEADLVRETLKLFGGNREKTANVLGIGERTLYRKIKEYKL
jgi:two-component system response regulator HydG